MKTVDDEDISNSQSVQLPVSINKTLDLSASYLPPWFLGFAIQHFFSAFCDLFSVGLAQSDALILAGYFILSLWSS